MNKQLIVQMFARLQLGGCRPPAAYNASTAEAAAEVWLDALGELDEGELKAAVTVYLRSPNARWWPTPGQLLDLIPGCRTIDDADQCWGLLSRLVEEGRPHEPPTPHGHAPPEGRRCWQMSADLDQDAAMHAGLLALGGWRALCDAPISADVANRASYREAHRAERARRQATSDWSATAPQLTDGGPAGLLDG